jgi:hypothetical protein
MADSIVPLLSRIEAAMSLDGLDLEELPTIIEWNTKATALVLDLLIALRAAARKDLWGTPGDGSEG